MPKQPMNSTKDTEEKDNPDVRSPAVQDLKSLQSQVIFTPTSVMSRVKAQFWTRFEPGPLASVDNITLAIAKEVTKSATIKKWWSQPGFPEWFSNRQEEKERLKYLFNKSLDSLEQILDNPDANPNAKANIIKMLAEMNGYMGKKTETKFADEEIGKMSEGQLKQYLRKKGVKLVEETVVDVKPKD